MPVDRSQENAVKAKYGSDNYYLIDESNWAGSVAGITYSIVTNDYTFVVQKLHALGVQGESSSVACAEAGRGKERLQVWHVRECLL